METNSELIGMLNDLVRINRDRAAGYQKAMNELKPTDIDLKTMFANMAGASVENEHELALEISELGGTPVSESIPSGKIYRIWMDIRSGLSSRDRRSVLSLCEFGEDAALKAYKLALESDVPIPDEVRQLIEDQQEELQKAHDIVKRHRDMQESVRL
jgi:uncharacterized protein (TIGR02284 family)